MKYPFSILLDTARSCWIQTWFLKQNLFILDTQVHLLFSDILHKFHTRWNQFNMWPREVGNLWFFRIKEFWLKFDTYNSEQVYWESKIFYRGYFHSGFVICHREILGVYLIDTLGSHPVKKIQKQSFVFLWRHRCVDNLVWLRCGTCVLQPYLLQ